MCCAAKKRVTACLGSSVSPRVVVVLLLLLLLGRLPIGFLCLHGCYCVQQAELMAESLVAATAAPTQACLCTHKANKAAVLSDSSISCCYCLRYTTMVKLRCQQL
jgi:hypothetical protein